MAPCTRLAATLAIGFCALQPGARAAEIQALSTIAVQSVVEELVPAFEKSSGHSVKTTFGLGVAMAKRVQDGEGIDLFIGPRASIDALLKSGRLTAGSEANLARSSVGIAVRKGAPKPDISSADALKRTLVAAKSVSYSNPAFGGASGVHFAKGLERLGIAEAMKPKIKFPPAGGFNGRLLAAGEVDMAVQQIGELMSVPGIEVLGPLPGDLQSVTTFAAAIPSAARQPDAARAFIQYLQSPEAAAVMKAKGLDPIAELR